jgi:hypothetical protein
VINKKNLLHLPPDDIAIKDAIHVAIVSVRAAQLIEPGQRCGLNQYNEAVPDSKGPGVANPFAKQRYVRGEVLWLLMDQKEIPNVQHMWAHPTIAFDAPTRLVKGNSTIEHYANAFGVTYEQLMEACENVVEGKSTVYRGTKTEDEVEEVQGDCYDLWSEWSSETGHEFEDYGSACCPEYQYPEMPLFTVADDS